MTSYPRWGRPQRGNRWWGYEVLSITVAWWVRISENLQVGDRRADQDHGRSSRSESENDHWRCELLREVHALEENGQETAGILQQALVARNAALSETGEAMVIAEAVNVRGRAGRDENTAMNAGAVQRIGSEAQGPSKQFEETIWEHAVWWTVPEGLRSNKRESRTPGPLLDKAREVESLMLSTALTMEGGGSEVGQGVEVEGKRGEGKDLGRRPHDGQAGTPGGGGCRM